MQNESQDLWADGPLKGAYDRSSPSQRGRFGPRDAGSLLATSTLMSGPVIAMSYELDRFAAAAYPSLPTGAAGVSSYLMTMSLVVALKVAGSVMRSYGASFIHDVGAWLWSKLMAWIFPGRARRVERRAKRRRKWLPWRRHR